ncbi:MAG: tyrosine--tRNA ligase [Thermogemmatispora sp.]|uniref:Tyrosine--tRNA ligase n=1 Tax=Thermogemmatispora aurantia TaxID=2045279 RepID=A0A5J4K8M3_9CHLR|nr:tyrosine--tRNA ligase [Thermogemmatispora sp.]MBE3566439.1 tyrosine--tRNA ligase [Thermogemmatispora sp.]GER83050.1 tyrosine--tRNA ligase [Thermogemmatispora aurantia]
MTVKHSPEPAEIERVLKRGVVLVEKEEELRRLLLEGNRGEPLRVKLGVDPSHYELTIGHAVVFRKLRQFQRLGHKAVVVIGDWTARLGDPSGRENARKPLSAEQVKANAATYLDQFYRIVDREQTEVRWQSEWFDQFTLADVMRLLSYKTVAQMLARDDFAKRFHSGIEIYLSELMYPLLQGYDSVALRADVEIGGTDQTFNLLVGRELQPIFGQPPQQILTVQLIVGLDGQLKMGKSLNNYIALTAPPNDMYGKLMSLPDHAMRSYFETLTDVPDEELEEMSRKMAEGTLNPMVVKRRMAREIVSEFHGPEAAQAAEEAFIRQFSQRQLPEEMPLYPLTEPVNIVTLLVEARLVPSRNEARRLIQQGGVSFFPHGATSEVQKIETPDFMVPPSEGAVLKVGKLRYLRITSPSSSSVQS